MPDNATIADALFELADLLEVQRRPAYHTRAFRKAALAIESLPRPASDLLVEGLLTDVPGIGQGVARRVGELVETGGLRELEELRAKSPRGLAEIMRVDGVGPKGAQLVWKQLGVTTLDELERAAKQQRLRTLPRWSEKKEQRILDGVAAYRRRRERRRLNQAWPMAMALVEQVEAIDGVTRVELVGQMRRREAMVDGIDLLACAPHAAAVCEAFARLGPVRERKDDLRRAPVELDVPRQTVRLREGLYAELHVVGEDRFGTAMVALTGNAAHLQALADLRGELPRAGDEAAVFRALELEYIEPELREGHGEVEAAAHGTLPKLIEVADLRGDLHMHTVETDGRATLEEMVEAAARLGHEYIAITDHSQALAFTNGLNAERLRAQGRQIDALNDRYGGKPTILRGIEADILADGSVDLGPEVLRELDWVIGSVHSLFRLSRAEQTRRVQRALESGLVDVLGHPTGRILGHRDPYPIDIEAVLETARKVGCAVELNAYPDRLDLSDEHLRIARSLGVPVVISTDSHATRHLQQRQWGVYHARRGWLTAADVANTRPLGELRALFAGRR